MKGLIMGVVRGSLERGTDTDQCVGKASSCGTGIIEMELGVIKSSPTVCAPCVQKAWISPPRLTPLLGGEVLHHQVLFYANVHTDVMGWQQKAGNGGGASCDGEP